MPQTEDKTDNDLPPTEDDDLQGRTKIPKLSEAFSIGKTLAAEKETSCEACVEFSKAHYPDGLNSNFFVGDETHIVDDHISKFENPESRDVARAVPDIMSMLTAHAGLTESTVIADIGAGTGLFLEPLSSAAKAVYAMEISPSFLNHLRKQVKVRRLQNVNVVEGSAKDPCLAPGSIDIVVICDVYHHFEYPKTICKHLKEALRPGGKLVIIDLIRDESVHKSHPQGWISEHVRADQAVFRSEIESVGFRLCSEPRIPSLDENYCMIFEF